MEHDEMFALGHLASRLNAFRRAALTLRDVREAVLLARRYGVAEADIIEMLHPYGLEWDTKANRIIAGPGS